MNAIPGLIVGVVVVLYLLSSIHILKEYERGVVFRLGKLLPESKGPGVILVFRPIDSIVKVSLRTAVHDVPPQDIITRDNVSVKVNAVIYYRVMDAPKAIVEVENYNYATSQLSQTTLRSVLGQVDLDDLLSRREHLNQQLQQILDQPAHVAGGIADRREIFPALFVELLAGMLLQQARVRIDVPQRCAQIMRNRIGKCLEFLIDHFELGRAFQHPLLEFSVEPAHFRVSDPAFRDFHFQRLRALRYFQLEGLVQVTQLIARCRQLAIAFHRRLIGGKQQVQNLQTIRGDEKLSTGEKYLHPHVRGFRFPQMLIRQDICHPRKQVPFVVGLEDEIVRAGLEALHDVDRIVERGEQDHRHGLQPLVLFEVAAEFIAIHLRHDDIADHEGRTTRGDERQRFPAIARRRIAVLVSVQDVL